MAFIKVQKLVRNEDGSIKSGSASILTTEYDPSYKGRSRHRTREKLGKVISLDSAGKSGVFLSPTRGLVSYDSVSDAFETLGKEDPRTKAPDLFAEPEIHTVFGDVYLFLKFCEKSGLIKVLRTAFPQDREYEQLLSHLLHSVLKDGSKVSFDDFIGKSFASYLFDEITSTSLASDTVYFSMMGEDSSRVAFFKAFVSHMRKGDPKFGTSCYVDSTPLTNTIRDNPFSNGIQGTSIQTRLVLVLDEKTGFPVWYSIIPNNVLDLGVLNSIMEDVAETLDVCISSFVLDAAYASKALFEAFHGGNKKGKTMTVRMPAKDGYPHNTLYLQGRKLMESAKYEFISQGHTYFGKHFETDIFGFMMHAYVYVDKDSALQGCRDYRLDYEDEYQDMTDKEKNWTAVRFGFFIILSTEMKSPDVMLDYYLGKSQTVFSASKEYLDLLPMSKLSDLTVRGKILSDIISNIALLQLREKLSGPGIPSETLIGKTQSLMCTRKKDGTVIVEVPTKQVSDLFQELKVTMPSSVSLETFKTETLKLKIR